MEAWPSPEVMGHAASLVASGPIIAQHNSDGWRLCWTTDPRAWDRLSQQVRLSPDGVLLPPSGGDGLDAVNDLLRAGRRVALGIEAWDRLARCLEWALYGAGLVLAVRGKRTCCGIELELCRMTPWGHEVQPWPQGLDYDTAVKRMGRPLPPSWLPARVV